MEFINSEDGIKYSSGEVFRFNTTLMAGFRLALRFIKVPDYSAQLTGNARILWEIFEEYRKAEQKDAAGDNLHPNAALAAQHRFDIISRIVPAMIFKYAFDSAYREVGNWLLWRLIQNAHRFRFPPHHLDPACWYRDFEDPENHPDYPGGKRNTPGLIIPPSNIVSADDKFIVTRETLPPQRYFAAIDGVDHWVAIDSNRPVWATVGWAYRVYLVYGSQEELEKRSLLGE